ncbi:phage tail protein [Pseudomonas sp. 5P_5.1_Bac1]|uniref:phage tail protein n=1 Tax=Pseudomonas sp. 5P_5.1_Bac1 TaxID=2971616 RepID=UPI0021C5A87E|nr:phage tail protein [Pseudomonas sp. 5P_5.1_Bac1]MCU1722435.1 phage tail protein [Pseudomonas sp. 5P_5.1_Bac1]
MTDQHSQFFAILTAVGEAKQANANALGVPWTFAQMGVGDANGTDPVPSRAQTKLLNEQRRAPLNQLKIDPNNPNIIIAEQVIPPDVGGWWIRELGLYDAAGDLVAVANCAPSFKPQLSQGTGKTQVVRLHLIVTSTATVQLKIDPAVVLATRDYVDTAFLTVLPRNKVPGTYTKVEINERGIVVAGANPTTLEGYGISPASQADATAGLDNGKPMTALRVFQAIAAKVVQATEGVQGLARLATQVQTDVGSDDLTMVTPKKLKGRLDAVVAWINETLTAALAGKADKSTTLDGYGISRASQAEATAGLDNDKPMTALRVFQAIAAKVVQATEGVQGLARLATQVQTDVGSDDLTMVTPKKLKGRLDAVVAWINETLTAALAGKADKSTTLDGYGISRASQAEATAGLDNDKPMTALRVFQAIAAKVVQATEGVQGLARLASQAQTDAGTDDLTMITPKKLRWGFQILLAQNGYIVLPSWLGGLVLQWGSIGFTTYGVKTFTFPIAFPNFALRGLAVLSDSTIYSFTSNPFAGVLIDSGNRTSAQVQSTYATASSVTVFAIGH